MARKLFKRISEDGQKLIRGGQLASLGHRIHDPNLWHLNRHSVARAFAAGMFAGFAFILFPGQMLIAAFLAIWLRGNLPIAISLVWITNPFTSPPILYASLKIGLILFPVQHHLNLKSLLDFEWSIAGIEMQIKAFVMLVHEVWEPLLAGTLIIGTLLAMLSYLLVQWFWRWHVVRDWNKRQSLRRIKRNAP